MQSNFYIKNFWYRSSKVSVLYLRPPFARGVTKSEVKRSQRALALKLRILLLHLANLTPQLFHDLLSISWVNLEGVEPLGCTKFQLYRLPQPFYSTILCSFRDLNESFWIEDFFRHVLASFNYECVRAVCFICFAILNNAKKLRNFIIILFLSDSLKWKASFPNVKRRYSLNGYLLVVRIPKKH